MGNNPYTWREILRTERFGTLTEAEAYALKLTNGIYTTPYNVYTTDGINVYVYDDPADHAINDYGSVERPVVRYKVTLDKNSEIQLSNSFEETFVKVD